jgi:hypothetical protein
MDESYGPITMVVGGWLCDGDRWKRIESQWQRRIDYENRKNKKLGMPPISRYKAADLNAFKQEFAQGWDRDRSKQFTSKMISILGRGSVKLQRPIGICCGVRFSDLLSTFPANNKALFKVQWGAYRLCMMQSLRTVADTIRRGFPSEQVAIIYDRGPFGGAAQAALSSIKADPKINGYFTTAAPMDWQQRVALQPADLIAFEGYKLVNSANRERKDWRKSLQKIIGSGLFVRVREISKEALDQIAESMRLAPENPDEPR